MANQEFTTYGADIEGTALVFDPMNQFIPKPLFSDGAVHWYTVTNSTLWMFIAVSVVALVFVLGSRGRALVPSRAQSIGEILYGFVHKMIEDVIGRDGLKYFPWIMTIFCFIFFSNMLGLLPMSFSPTSQISVAAFLGFGVFFVVTFLGFFKNGASFLGLFWMSEAPLFLRPIIAIIEVISYFVRPVSHSIRLAGNITAGHAVIKVFAAFAALTAIAPVSVLAITAIYGLEVLVAAIQAYVFTILTCVYLKDALHPQH